VGFKLILLRRMKFSHRNLSMKDLATMELKHANRYLVGESLEGETSFEDGQHWQSSALPQQQPQVNPEAEFSFAQEIENQSCGVVDRPQVVPSAPDFFSESSFPVLQSRNKAPVTVAAASEGIHPSTKTINENDEEWEMVEHSNKDETFSVCSFVTNQTDVSQASSWVDVGERKNSGSQTGSGMVIGGSFVSNRGISYAAITKILEVEENKCLRSQAADDASSTAKNRRTHNSRKTETTCEDECDELSVRHRTKGGVRISRLRAHGKRSKRR